MSLMRSGGCCLSKFLCLLFACFLISTEVFAQDDYLQALSKAAGEDVVVTDTLSEDLKVASISASDRAEFKTRLFKM